MIRLHRGDYFLDEDEELLERRAKRKKKILHILLLVAILIVLIAAFILLFHTRKINVTGNEYSSEDEVREWIQKDKLSSNSLYVWWKFNYLDAEQLPLVDTMEITMKSPWEINARVYEKSIVGYLDFEGTHVYIDKDGVVVASTVETIEGVALIEGISVDSKKIVVHEKLPLEDTSAFENVSEVTQAMETQGLKADKITISETGDVSVQLGIVAASLGNSDFDDKIAQLPPVLQKLTENYPNQAGTLHLESYSKTHSYINFTPE